MDFGWATAAIMTAAVVGMQAWRTVESQRHIAYQEHGADGAKRISNASLSARC